MNQGLLHIQFMKKGVTINRKLYKVARTLCVEDCSSSRTFYVRVAKLKISPVSKCQGSEDSTLVGGGGHSHPALPKVLTPKRLSAAMEERVATSGVKISEFLFKHEILHILMCQMSSATLYVKQHYGRICKEFQLEHYIMPLAITVR